MLLPSSTRRRRTISLFKRHLHLAHLLQVMLAGGSTGFVADHDQRPFAAQVGGRQRAAVNQRQPAFRQRPRRLDQFAVIGQLRRTPFKPVESKGQRKTAEPVAR
jgi:hypothetical protein